MVINENLSQTNTFVGGMNTDIADELLQNNQYRYAENIRVTADGDSKSAKASLINGLTDMEITYDTDEPQEIIKVDSIKNYVCLITKQRTYVDGTGNTVKNDQIEYIKIPKQIRFASFPYILWANQNNISYDGYGVVLSASDGIFSTGVENNSTFKAIMSRYGDYIQSYYKTQTDDSNIFFSVDVTYKIIPITAAGREDTSVEPISRTIDVQNFYEECINYLDYCAQVANVNPQQTRYYIDVTFSVPDEYFYVFAEINIPESNETEEFKSASAWNVFVNTDYGRGTFERVFGPCIDFFWDETSESHGINTELYWVRDNNVKLYMSSPLRNHDIIYVNLAIRYNSGNITDVVNNELLIMHAPTVEKNDTPSGTLEGPILYYAYRLFAPNGNNTPISPISKKITLYDESGDGHGLREGHSSGQSCTITVPKECFNGYENIYIYRIEYKEDGEIPNVINITGITGYQLDPDTDFTIVDSVQTNANVYKKEDSAEFLSVIVKDGAFPSILKIKDDRLYKADIGYSQDNIDDLFSEIDTIIQTSGNTNIYKNAQFDGDNIGAYNKNYWKAQDNTIGGDGEYISWRLKWRTEKLFFFWANGGSTKCLRSEEQYRFGIVFYTNTGQHTNPMWMCDIMLPDPVVHDAGEHQSSEPSVVRNPYMEVDIPYIQFDVDTTKIKDKVSSFIGYEIVIAQRREEDTINITQGLYSDVRYGLPAYREKNGQLSPYGVSLFFSPEVVVNEEFGNYIAKYIRNHNIQPACKGVYKCFYDNYTPASTLAAVRDLVTQEFGPEENIVLDSGAVTMRYRDGQYYFEYIGSDDTQYTSLLGEPYGRDIREFMERKTIELGRLLYTPKFKTDDGDHEGDSTAQNSKTGYCYLVKPGSSTFEYTVTNHYAYNHNREDILHPIGYLNIFIPKIKDGRNINFPPNCKVEDARLVNTPNGSNLKAIENWRSYVTSVGNETFYAWDIVLAQNKETALEQYSPEHDMEIRFPGTYVGQCIVMQLSERDGQNSSEIQDSFNVVMAVLKQQNVQPYGGCTKNAINNTKYVSFGHYCPWTTAREEIKEAADGTSFGMFGFMMYHNYVHGWENNTPVKCGMRSGSMGAFCVIPTFSRFDLDAWTGAAVNEREGWLDFDRLACMQYYKVGYVFKKFHGDWENPDVYTQKYPGNYEYNQTKDEFEYNARYNKYQNLIIHEKTKLFSDEVYADQRNRIYASNPADAVVSEDGMLVFDNKYINIPSLYGDITCLANFRNRLYFWQEKAFGTVDIDERSVVPQQTDKDGTSHVDLIIGKSGLLDRYDYYSREYGMAPKENCYVVTDGGLYWWDSNKREILLFNGQSIIQLATVKGVKSYTINGIPSTNPTILYDDINKEVIFSILNEESIVYSEQTQQFISVYKINPKTGTRTTSDLIMSNGDGIYQYNAFSSNGSSVGFNGEALYPKLKFMVNKNSAINKTFDTVLFGGNFYPYTNNGCYKHDLSKLSFVFNTDLNQHSELNSSNITDEENDFRFSIPRNGDTAENRTVLYGNRMRGKTMECEISSSDNSTDFSLQYITTKFRISWT